MSDGPFHHWLLGTQIVPTFRANVFLRRADVLVIPRLWLIDRHASTELFLAYSAKDALDLDATLDALATGGQDPHLPEGISNWDLHRPIAAGVPMRFVSRESFRGLARGPEGFYEDLDAFAAYASFARGEGDTIALRRVDAKLGKMIDVTMPAG